MKILFTGGGTAGHVIPIIAIVRELRRMGIDAEFFFLGPKDEYISIFLSQEEIKTRWVLAGKIRRYFGWKSLLQNIFDILFKLPIGFIQSLFHVFLIGPDLVFSKGGYGSVSPVIAATLLQVPIFLHESDIAPGLANRFTGKLAPKIFVAFPAAQTEYFPAKKMISIGNPIRRELLNGDKVKAKKLFGLVGGKPLLLILGGSQGANKINNMILAILPEILSNFEIIHQVGAKNIKQVKAEARVVASKELETFYHPIGLLNEIELRDAFSVCDLIVSRAGAGSIFEIAAVNKPSILIPLSLSAQNHQVKNAYTYAKDGAALVLEEPNLTPHFFLEKVKRLFAHPAELEKMSQKAKEFSKPDSAKIIAGYIMDYLVK